MEIPQQNLSNSDDGTSVNTMRAESNEYNGSNQDLEQRLSQYETNVSHSSEVLAKGVSTTLAAVIRDFDSKAQDTLKSQEHLNSTIDRLAQELDQLLEDAPLPFIMQHAARISGVRKRVLSLNSLLKSIQRRLDNIDRIISLGTQQEKTTEQSS